MFCSLFPHSALPPYLELTSQSLAVAMPYCLFPLSCQLRIASWIFLEGGVTLGILLSLHFPPILSFLPHPLPYLPGSPPLQSYPFPSPSLEVGPLNPAMRSGGAVSSPMQRGLRRSPASSRNRIWCILAVKYDIWWQKFNDFPENQHNSVRAVEKQY